MDEKKLRKISFDGKESIVPQIPTDVSAFTNDAGYLTASDIENKQDKLTAGDNITITDNTISATDTTYENATTSADGLMSSADKTKLDGLTNFTCDDVSACPTVTALRTDVDNLTTAVDGKQDKLTAGENITITDNTIAAEVPEITKAKLLEILGMEEIELSKTDTDGTEVSYTILAKANQ